MFQVRKKVKPDIFCAHKALLSYCDYPSFHCVGLFGTWSVLFMACILEFWFKWFKIVRDVMLSPEVEWEWRTLSLCGNQPRRSDRLWDKRALAKSLADKNWRGNIYLRAQPQLSSHTWGTLWIERVFFKRRNCLLTVLLNSAEGYDFGKMRANKNGHQE